MSKPPRTPARRIIGAVLVVVALAGLAVGAFAFVVLIKGESEVDGSRFDLPGSTNVSLDADTYEIWVEGAGGGHSSGNCTVKIVRSVMREAEPVVTATDGRRLDLDYQDECSSKDPADNEDKAVTALRVEIERDGEYELSGGTVDTPSGQSLYLQPVASSPLSKILTVVAGFIVGAAALILRIERF